MKVQFLLATVAHCAFLRSSEQRVLSTAANRADTRVRLSHELLAQTHEVRNASLLALEPGLPVDVVSPILAAPDGGQTPAAPAQDRALDVASHAAASWTFQLVGPVAYHADAVRDLGEFADAAEYATQALALRKEQQRPNAALEVHTAQAAVLAAALCLVWLVVAWGLGAEEEAEGRMAVLDNAKFVAILFVLLGHFINGLRRTGEAWPWNNEIKLFVVFHTRMFCFVSGVVTRVYKPHSLRSVALAVLAPAVFVCVLLEPVLFPLTMGTVPRAADAAAEALDHLLYPATGPVWYLFALAQWRLLGYALLPLQPALRLAAAVVISAGAGYVPLPLFRTGTALHFLPVFVLGQVFPFHAAMRKVPANAATCGAGVLLLAGVFAWEVYAHNLVEALPYLDGWSAASYGSPAEAGLFWARGMCRNLIELTKVLLFLLLCCPRGASAITELGAHSLYPYLLHLPVLEWRALLLRVPAGSAPPLALWAGAVLFLAAVIAVLASPPVRAVFGGLLEPTWLGALWPAPAREKRGA